MTRIAAQEPKHVVDYSILNLSILNLLVIFLIARTLETILLGETKALADCFIAYLKIRF